MLDFYFFIWNPAQVLLWWSSQITRSLFGPLWTLCWSWLWETLLERQRLSTKKLLKGNGFVMFTLKKVNFVIIICWFLRLDEPQTLVQLREDHWLLCRVSEHLGKSLNNLLLMFYISNLYFLWNHLVRKFQPSILITLLRIETRISEPLKSELHYDKSDWIPSSGFESANPIGQMIVGLKADT